MTEQTIRPGDLVMPDAQTAQLGRRIGRLALLIVIIATMVQGGLRLRLWAYAASGEFRFRGDITNAWQQGLFVLEGAQAIQNDSEPVRLGSFIKSYLGRYDQAMSESQRGTYRLDYPPARLLIMSAWAWRMEQFARNNDLAPYDYRIVWPLLCLNALFELAGSAAAFLLVRSVLQRQGVRNAEFIALIPAALIWFNLAMIIDAHVWPQWDTWLIPFYLLAAYAAVERKWVLAGMALGFGAMFKGQMLLTMAVFILWPLFQMRWRAVLEVAAGILLGAMIYAAPWMVHSMGVGVCVLLFFVLLGAGFRWINPTWRPLYVASGIGVTLLIAGLFWGGSFGWWWVGFEYGSHHYMNMTMGPTPNLAAILSDGFSFGLRQELFSITPDIVVTTRSLMITIYIAALVLCAAGIAIQDSRNDRRLLIALATPWVIMFAFLPQMHDRYLVWGAALTALAAAVSLGTTLLHLVVTFLACLPLGCQLINFHRGPIRPEIQDAVESWQRFFNGMYPGAAWATVLAALVLLYLSVVPSGPRREIVLPTAESEPVAN